MFDHRAAQQGPGAPTPGAAQPPQRHGIIRQLRATERYRYTWHKLRVEGPRRHAAWVVPSWGLEEHAGIEPVVIGCVIGRHIRGAAVLRPLQAEGWSAAEITLSVEEAWRGGGIGTALMAEAVESARGRGIRHLYLVCHALNHPVQRIAERFQASIAFEDCEYLAEITVS